MIASTSAVSSIEDDVLRYRGYRVEELAERCGFEEVAYLLLNSSLPTGAELSTLGRTLGDFYELPGGLISAIEQLPHGAPMDVMRSAASLLALYDHEAEDGDREANLRKATRLTARLPVLTASLPALLRGDKAPTPDSSLPITANFLWMLWGEEPEPEMARALEVAFILHADHELNASTFAARVTAGTLAGIYAAITAALAALQGPLHGGAGAQVLAALDAIGDERRVEAWLEVTLAEGRRVPGFGHRVYKNGDPRALILKGLVQGLSRDSGEDRLYLVAARLEEQMLERTGLLPNVDFYSAPLYELLGIPRNLFPAVFASARIVGWCAHVMEQYEDNKLIRPRALYTGHGPREWQPIEARS